MTMFEWWLASVGLCVLCWAPIFLMFVVGLFIPAGAAKDNYEDTCFPVMGPLLFAGWAAFVASIFFIGHPP